VKAGDLMRGRDPVALAREMAGCRVAGISVVTEASHFGGRMDLLRAVAAAVDLPVLHKDFITTDEQLEASAAAGATAVLLISAFLASERIDRLIRSARACGLETLVEVRSLAEIERVGHLPFDLMGINNRDITRYEVDGGDVGRTEALARFGKDHRPLISESAIRSAADTRRAGAGGADAVLVGTAVLQAERASDLLHALTSVGWPV